MWRRKVVGVDPRRFKFLDQTGAKTTLTRLYGRAPRGQRVREYVPDGRWQSLTLMGTLGFRGDTTAFVYAGGTDVMALLTYVEAILGPALGPGDIVVLDRLSSHLDPQVIAALEAPGAEVWHLPPYSHDLNPIEQMWSKVKAYLRKVKPRDMETLIAWLEANDPPIRALSSLAGRYGTTSSRCGRLPSMIRILWSMFLRPQRRSQLRRHSRKLPAGMLLPSPLS